MPAAGDDLLSLLHLKKLRNPPFSSEITSDSICGSVSNRANAICENVSIAGIAKSNMFDLFFNRLLDQCIYKPFSLPIHSFS